MTAIRRHNIMTSEHTRQFEHVLERVATVAAQRKATDEALGEIPEQFLDAIMGSVMTYALTPSITQLSLFAPSSFPLSLFFPSPSFFTPHPSYRSMWLDVCLWMWDCSDPVTLPMSKQVVDRSTIKRHLLNTPKDPFTRQPLTIGLLSSPPPFVVCSFVVVHEVRCGAVRWVRYGDSQH